MFARDRAQARTKKSTKNNYPRSSIHVFPPPLYLQHTFTILHYKHIHTHTQVSLSTRPKRWYSSSQNVCDIMCMEYKQVRLIAMYTESEVSAHPPICVCVCVYQCICCLLCTVLRLSSTTRPHCALHHHNNNGGLAAATFAHMFHCCRDRDHQRTSFSNRIQHINVDFVFAVCAISMCKRDISDCVLYTANVFTITTANT